MRYEFGGVDPVEMALGYLVVKQGIFCVELRKPTATPDSATCLIIEIVHYLYFHKH